MITNPGQEGSFGRAWDRFAAPTERYRRPFRRWRRGRPFYAGFFILLAGLEIYAATQSGLGKLLSMGVPGISTIFISVFLAIFAVTVWFFPAYRVFSGIAAIMVALLSLVATNLGGFLLGFLLGMLGGAFAVAWTPRTDLTADTRRQQRRIRTTAAETAETAGFVSQNAESVYAQAPDGPSGTGTEPSAAPAEPAARAEQNAPTELSAQAPAEPDGSVADAAPDGDGGNDAEHSRNTRIIEQYARSDEADPAEPEPSPEEE
jgi:hypothetical protein